jgi:hypothetical protein
VDEKAEAYAKRNAKLKELFDRIHDIREDVLNLLEVTAEELPPYTSLLLDNAATNLELACDQIDGYLPHYTPKKFA